MIVVVWATVYAVSEAINENSTFNPELGIWLHGVVWAPQGEEYVQDLEGTQQIHDLGYR